MKMKLAVSIMLLAVFAMPAVADDVDRWIQNLKDPSPSVREAAARALGELNDPRAVDPLIQALKDEDYSVRFWSAASLRNLNNAKAVYPLIQLLNDKEGIVREQAAHALGRFKDDRAIDPLINALTDDYEPVRDSAAMSLGALKDPRAVKPLIQALKDENEFVRMSAADSLGEIGESSAIEPLIQALEDDNMEVRSIAEEALKKLGWQKGTAKPESENVPVKMGEDQGLVTIRYRSSREPEMEYEVTGYKDDSMMEKAIDLEDFFLHAQIFDVKNQISLIKDGECVVPHGKVLVYRDGNVLIEGEYKNGLKEGAWAFWRAPVGDKDIPEGLKEAEGQYRNGLAEGHWIGYKHGTETQWNPKCAEGDISKGEEVKGTWTCYDLCNLGFRPVSCTKYSEGLPGLD
jgi:antitoxin component YwqK of YwqJK toxin-antitoxin module